MNFKILLGNLKVDKLNSLKGLDLRQELNLKGTTTKPPAKI